MNYNAPDTSKTDIATGLYRAIRSGDLAAASQFLDPEIVLHVPGTHRLAGEHRGRTAFAHFAQQTRALTVDGEQIDILDILDILEGDDHVAVYCRVRAERSNGAELDNTTVHIMRINAGVVTEAWLHNWDDVTVNRFWN
jgi:ketosteroid isomerase-like protein